MSLPNLYVRVNGTNNGPGFVAFTSNVVSFNITSGRQALLDTYGATTADVTIRLTSGNSADLALVKVGLGVVLAQSATDYATTARRSYMKVSDVRYEYSVAPNSDYVVLSLEGNLAAANRSQLDNFNLAANDIVSQLSTVSSNVPGTYTWVNSSIENPLMDGTTITSVADWLQTVVTTVNGRVRDIAASGTASILSKYYYAAWTDLISTKTFVLTDGTLTVGAGELPIAYDVFDYSSLGQNYFTAAIVDPLNHAAQTAGTDKTRVLTLSTLNYNTAQAQDYANYLVNLYDDPQLRPQTLSINGQVSNADTIFHTMGSMVGCSFPVIFRGVRTTVVIEGFSYTADPGASRWTLSVSGADLNNYLILDDASRGVLDSNRLGY